MNLKNETSKLLTNFIYMIEKTEPTSKQIVVALKDSLASAHLIDSRYQTRIEYLEKAVAAGNTLFGHFADITLAMSLKDDWDDELSVLHEYAGQMIGNYAVTTPAWIQHYIDDKILEAKKDD